MARQERERPVSAREEIFGSIRRALHVTGREAPRRAAVEARLSRGESGVIPERGQGDAAHRAATFRAEAARAQASLADVAGAGDIPAEVARFLRENNLAATLRMGEDPRLAALPWDATTLEISRGPSDGHDPNSVSVAFAAVAESGTLALASGPDNPTTLNFLPDNHIVVVFAADLVGDYESVFAKLRVSYGPGAAPRTLNFITGPSRSADIEQTLLLGAHGPRRLHIVVVGAPQSAPQESRGGDLATKS
jgi:L-lactate dehydrogenase complex protein LldG